MVTLANLLKVSNEKLKELNVLNVLNVYLNCDSGYYINVNLLSKTDNIYFKNSYQKVIEYFNKIYNF